jgi:hypothetical protein
MLWFRIKLYCRTVAAAWQTFGLSQPLLVHAIRRPLAMGFTQLTMALDNVFFPAYRRVEVQRPIFIIGHPRSGTTFLHSLLAKSYDYCTFEAWEIFFPALAARRLVRPLVARAIAQGKASCVPGEAGHEVVLDQVEEEELLFYAQGNTQFSVCLSPLALSDWDFAELVYADRQPARIRRQTMAFLKGCFQRQIYATGKGLVLAKVNFSGMRIDSLLEAFPDARIIYLVRSPLETIPSHLTLDRNVFDHLWGLERIPQDRLRRYYERRYRYDVAFYRYLEEWIARGRLPPGRCMTLRYEDLCRDPTARVRDVAQFAGLEVSRDPRETIGRQQVSYRPKHKNLALEEFGLSKQQVLRDLDFVFDKYGFPK